MRLIVFFDLPMVTKDEKRAYVQFRRFLLNDGYDMIQWSVYGRILNGKDAETKHLARLADSLPPAGSVRCMTERWPRLFGQYCEIYKWNARGSHAADLIAGSVA
ncbi:CRISPR-associated endonuclease Cas2, partial [Bordetella sp. FB-8]|uniref:CRISPR-associated endonuclease Cas2 n=1 Tax=Bordetella sp. FB-8 TaxID=1159870 RepID=UPI0009DB2388